MGFYPIFAPLNTQKLVKSAFLGVQRGENGFSLFCETPRLTRRPPPVLLPATRQVKLNTDESPSVATEYGIRSIPTVMIFKGGQELDTVIGAVPKSTLTGTIEKYL